MQLGLNAIAFFVYVWENKYTRVIRFSRQTNCENGLKYGLREYSRGVTLFCGAFTLEGVCINLSVR